jgi:hypothetical protein
VIAVPSEFSPGSVGAAEDSADIYDVDYMVENIGEDPGRWLDQDLEYHSVTRLKQRQVAGWDEDNQKLVTDESVSEPLEMVLDRIRSIENLEVARAWRAVELNLDRTPEDGREVIIDELEQRIEDLEHYGERVLPGLDPDEQRELAVEAYEAVAPKEEAVFLGEDGEPTSRMTGQTADQKLAAVTDGGEEE